MNDVDIIPYTSKTSILFHGLDLTPLSSMLVHRVESRVIYLAVFIVLWTGKGLETPFSRVPWFLSEEMPL